ncbi:MAG: amidohydrolase [Phycisphaeraceae bacterium]
MRTLQVLVTLLAFASQAVAAEPRAWVEDNLPPIVALYKELHQSPELSYQEEQTSQRMAKELKAVGAEVTTGVGGFGVIGILKNGTGPMLMLRADMDALPVTERTGLAYASTVKVKNPDDGNETGVMHACGHDVHMANLVGVARYLAANKGEWKGTVMFLFQPAEERGGGAKAMLGDKLFERFGKPDLAVAFHVDSYLETGKVGFRGGYAMANVDSVDITLKGKGGHGSQPQSTIDPIAQAGYLIVELQSIVSREIDPREAAVVTVGAIHGGTKHNIIPDTCELKLTVRSYTDEVRAKLLEAIERKAKAVAASFKAPEPEVKFSEGTPALFNHEDLTNQIAATLRKTLGKDNVVPALPSMGGEDFGRFGRAGVPICMYRVGSVNPDRLAKLRKDNAVPSAHSPLYYPDPQETLRTSMTTMSQIVLDLLKK